MWKKDTLYHSTRYSIKHSNPTFKSLNTISTRIKIELNKPVDFEKLGEERSRLVRVKKQWLL